jgi:predicted MFS family arabinose efflux permease
MRRVLALPAYRRLLAAYTLNELAFSIGSLALALLVYRHTGSALAAAGYFLCAMFGPALISPTIVARLDQRSSRPVLVVLYGLEALVFVVLAWVASRFTLAPILTLALVDGIVAVTARALARAATVTVTSAAGLLREGNAVTNTSFSVCFMAGPALGGVAVAFGGTVTALLINSGVFALIALTLATAVGLPGSVAERAAMSGRLRSALRYVRGQPLVRSVLGLQAAAMLFGTIPTPVEVVLADHTLHGGAGGYGALLSGWGAGAVVGSAIYARWHDLPARALIPLSTCWVGLGIGVMAVAPSIAVAIAGAVMAGVGNGIVFVASRTAVQEAVEDGWMALTMSLNESIYQAVPGIGIVVGGALTAAAGPRPALAVAGIGCVVTGFAARLTLRPWARENVLTHTSYENEGTAPLAPLTEAGRRRQAERGGAST